MVREDREDYDLQEGGGRGGGRGGGGANKSRRGPDAASPADAAARPGCYSCGQVRSMPTDPCFSGSDVSTDSMPNNMNQTSSNLTWVYGLAWNTMLM